jgi:pyruvate,water dikinase
VVSGRDAASLDAGLVGGKARNLRRLEECGQTVPAWYAVTAAAFRAALEEAGIAARLRERLREEALATDVLRARAAEIREAVRAARLTPELSAAVRARHADLFGEEAFVAVRSSAADEDAPRESFAGLHDSFLFVRGAEGVLDALRKVWASAYNDRALAYRLEKGLPLAQVAIAVIVQRMVDARSSGVLFTVNPVSGRLDEVVVSGVFGAGEGLVSAGLDADAWTVKKSDLSVRSEPAAKEERLVHDVEAGGGLRREPLPEPLRGAPSLDEEEVREVARAGLAIEASFGRPQDIEFSIDADGRLFILQSRPVTTVLEYGPAAGNPLLWDNSNIVESYSGVTSPMTFSFIRRAYASVYHSFAAVMGVSPRAVRRNRPTFENLLGLFRGHVYYNLHNWYRLVCLFPFERFLMRSMESMMGVREPIDLEDLPSRSLARRYLFEYPRLALLTAWNFLSIRRIVGRFEAHFKRSYAHWEAMDFGKLRPHELLSLYDEMEARLLGRWQVPIINDFYVMIFYGLLKRLSAAWCGDPAGSLQNDLIAGEGGIESTEPTKMLLSLAHLAQGIPGLRAAILERPAAELVESVPAEPAYAEFSELLRRYLDLYGFRCMNELKLEEPSLRDRPAFVYEVLRNYLAAGRADALDVGAISRREAAIRAAAEERAFGRLGPLKRAVFRRVLRNARLGVKNRENLRFARTRIYGLFRELLRALGAHLAGEGLLEKREDVFYLTLDEVRDFVKGTAVSTDLRGLVRLRREEFDRYREGEPPADRFRTYGMAYHRNLFRASAAAAPQGGEGTLRGTGCSPGEVTGPVKVLRDPSADVRLAGEILVAERTDPGWVPLYPSVSGILIERGSILSHSAIVAREMGIPTIVGIPRLTRVLASGQHVRMNGSSGVVEIVEREGGGE